MTVTDMSKYDVLQTNEVKVTVWITPRRDSVAGGRVGSNQCLCHYHKETPNSGSTSTVRFGGPFWGRSIGSGGLYSYLPSLGSNQARLTRLK